MSQLEVLEPGELTLEELARQANEAHELHVGHLQNARLASLEIST